MDERRKPINKAKAPIRRTNSPSNSSRKSNSSVPQKRPQGRSQARTNQVKTERTRTPSQYPKGVRKQVSQHPSNRNNIEIIGEEKRTYKPKRKRKLNKKFLTLLGVVLLIILVLVLSFTVLFPIKTIKVSGKSIYNDNQIIASSGVIVGDNLLSSSASRAEKSIIANCPYVEKIEFSRSLPFTLTIKVTQCNAVLQIKDGSNYIIVNKEGRILEVSSKLKQGATVLRGVYAKTKNVGDTISFLNDNDNSVFTTAISILKELNDNNLNGITVLNLKDMQYIKATYQNKIVLLFGSNANMDEKITHAVATLKLREGNDETGTLNLSRIPSTKNEASFIPTELVKDEIADVFAKK